MAIPWFRGGQISTIPLHIVLLLLQEPGSYEFAQMRATSNSAEEAEKGRLPKEQSRPATTTRAGFMESQGGFLCVRVCVLCAFCVSLSSVCTYPARLFVRCAACLCGCPFLGD